MRTVLSRAWSDFTASPGFMVGLAFRGWLYGIWLVVGTAFLLFIGMVCVLIPAGMLIGYMIHQADWHLPRAFHPLPQILSALLGQVWIGWCEFKTGRWIARRAPGRELAAGIATCLAPWVFTLPPWLLAMHFWGTEINSYIASHPVNSDSLPTFLPTEIFLLAGILWSRHKSVRRIAQ